MGPTRFPGLPYEKKVFFDMDRTLVQALENYQAMVKAGVNTGMGTDSGPNGRYPGFNAHEEMQLEVLAGRTPMDAIKSATSDNARWLGDNSIGTHRRGQMGRPAGAGQESGGGHSQHRDHQFGLYRGQFGADHLADLPRPA